MRKFILTALPLIFVFGAYTQKASEKKYNLKTLDLPRLAVSDIRSINFKIYNPKSSINQDSLRSYTGTMNLLNDYVIFPGQFPGRSLNPVTLVNEKADINIEIAFGQPQVIDMQPVKGFRNTLLGQVESYYYEIEYQFPVIVRLTGKSGELLDIWAPSSKNLIRYGYRKVTQRTDTQEGELLTINSNIFMTEAELEKNYLINGRYYVEREAMVLQLKKVIESIYDRIYFFQKEDKFEIVSGKGGKYDYKELDAARDKAVSAIETKNFDQLPACIATWKKYLEMGNDADKKSMINSEIKAGLLGNLAIANMYLREYKQALDFADAYVGQATYNYEKPNYIGKVKIETSDNLKSSDEVLLQAYQIQYLVNLRSEAFASNGSLTVPAKMYDGINFKKEIGRKDKNYKYDLFEKGDHYNSFTTQLNNLKNIKKENRGESVVTTNIPKTNPYEAKLQKVLGSKLLLLDLNFLDYPKLENGPFPAEITELKNLGNLKTTYFGFTSLPADFGKLRDLKDIEMYRNKFTSLPESLGELTNLRSANLSYNELKTIPAGMCNLGQLEVLNLANNKISSLPENVGNLASLKELDLKNNELTTLPESLKNCAKLKKLSLKGNKFSADELKKIQEWFPDVKIK